MTPIQASILSPQFVYGAAQGYMNRHWAVMRSPVYLLVRQNVRNNGLIAELKGEEPDDPR